MKNNQLFQNFLILILISLVSLSTGCKRDKHYQNEPTVTKKTKTVSVKKNIPDRPRVKIDREVIPAPPTEQNKSAIDSIPSSYVVESGDSLWKISRQFGIPINLIAEHNNMERDSALRVGQKLVIPTAESIRNSANTPDKTTSHSTKSTTKSTSSKSNRYGWPVKGDVIRRYSSNFKGLEISCNKSSFINAVADGEVIFSDVMDGYGKIVIIDHLNGIFTIYARLRSILVSNGDSIKNGQKVGRGGTPNDSGQTRMYFEFRKAKHEGDDPTPVDPMEYLR